MHRVYILLIIVHLGLFIKASHFRGGAITWKPIKNNITNGSIVSIMITQSYSWTRSQIGCNSSMVATQWPPINLAGRSGYGVDLMCISSCSTAGGYVGHEVPITGYCTDYSAALDLTVSQRSDIVNLTSGAHFTLAFAAGGGWQTLALGSSTGWSLSSTIDVRVRPDNGLINTPPVATCISFMSVPVHIQQSIQIPVLDADNDIVRCRFANGSSECVNTCPPGSLPNGTSLSSSCLLTITGPTANSYYLIAIQIEDFLTNTSTTPLSSVPLQFLIYVYSTQNCTLKPLLTSNLPSSSCFGVQVGQNFTMTFTAMNRCGSGRNISDIATLSFSAVTKSALVRNPTNSSLWSITVTWAPTVNQVGSQVFCAIAIDNTNVQSDQYCVTLFVGLNSVPLCPGVTTTTTTTTTTRTTTTTTTQLTSTLNTTASTTTQMTPTFNSFNTFTSMIMVTTEITSVSDSSDILPAFTSQQQQQQAQITTEIMTTMDIISSSIPETSNMVIDSYIPISTDKPSSSTNWPLIVGICSGVLLLAIGALICCYYHWLKKSVARRRLHRQMKSVEEGLRWRQYSKSRYQRVFRQVGPDQRKSSVVSGRSVAMSSISINKISQREKSFIDDQGNVINRPSSISARQIDRRTEVSQLLTLDQVPASRKNSNESSANITRIHLFTKLSNEPERPPSTTSSKAHPTKPSPRNLTAHGSNGSNGSNDLTTKTKRSSSVGHIKHSATTFTNVDLSRVTIIKMK